MIRNARIVEVRLGLEDHGIMTCQLTLDYGDQGRQGFGGCALDTWDAVQKRRVGTAYGLEWIMQLLRTLGVERLDQLTGAYVRADGDYTHVDRIGHLLHNQWFDPEAFSKAERMKERVL